MATPSQPQIAIRRAEPGDAALLSSLNREVQSVHAEALPELFKPAGSGTFSEFADLIAEPMNAIFIAEAESVPVGYVYAQITRHGETAWLYPLDLIHVHHIGVRESHRKAGVATRLLDALDELARAEGIGRVTLEVWAFNRAAREFFRRRGFELSIERLSRWIAPTKLG
jgi:ribosomal protein S18 acetylase RimI-like enzyme